MDISTEIISYTLRKKLANGQWEMKKFSLATKQIVVIEDGKEVSMEKLSHEDEERILKQLHHATVSGDESQSSRIKITITFKKATLMSDVKIHVMNEKESLPASINATYSFLENKFSYNMASPVSFPLTKEHFFLISKRIEPLSKQVKWKIEHAFRFMKSIHGFSESKDLTSENVKFIFSFNHIKLLTQA